MVQALSLLVSMGRYTVVRLRLPEIDIDLGGGFYGTYGTFDDDAEGTISGGYPRSPT